jgi:hypothetical protein
MTRNLVLSAHPLAVLALIAMPAAASAQSAEQLAQADSNGDGSVSKQELMDLRADMFGKLDRNGDGFADSKDSPTFGPPKKKFEEAFAKVKAADANGDGRVSRQEMIGAPTPRFDAADKDKNGILSSAEIAALSAAAE